MMNRILNTWDSWGLPGFLISVNIELTNHCQLRCRTCYRDDIRERGFMAWDTFERVVNQIHDIPTISSISLNGAGESTLHPRFIDAVDCLSDKKNKIGRRYKTGFSTNGNISVIKALDKVDTINLSLDGIGETHNHFRRGSSWDKVDRNVRELFDIKRNRTKIYTNLVRSVQSEEDIDAFKKYSQDVGFDGYNISNYHNGDLELIDRGDQHFGDYKACRQLHHTAMILWNGDVTTCCADLNGINACGNVLRTDLKNIRRVEGALCKKCDYWKIDEVSRR